MDNYKFNQFVSCESYPLFKTILKHYLDEQITMLLNTNDKEEIYKIKLEIDGLNRFLNVIESEAQIKN